MFEKEAEKWTIDYVCKDCSRYKECKSKEQCTCKECSKEKWQQGAEFGYNKCKEELNKIGLALQRSKKHHFRVDNTQFLKLNLLTARIYGILDK